MTLPHRGAAMGDAGGEFKMALRSALERELGALMEKVRPERVVAEWGNPRPVLGQRQSSGMPDEQREPQALFQPFDMTA